MLVALRLAHMYREGAPAQLQRLDIILELYNEQVKLLSK